MGLPTDMNDNMVMKLYFFLSAANLKQWSPDFTDGVHKSQSGFENADIIWPVRESFPLPHKPIEGSFMGNPSSLWLSC